MTESTPITLDKERKLVFDLGAMSWFEKETGINIMTENIWLKRGKLIDVNTKEGVIKIPEPEISATNLLALLWACLLREDPNIKIEEVGHMVGNHNVVEVTIALMIAFNQGMPKKEDTEEPEKEEDKKKATNQQP